MIDGLERDLAEQSLRSLSPADRARRRRAAGSLGINSRPECHLAAHEGHLAHPVGNAWSDLVFRYPLEGEFELSFEARGGQASQFSLGFAGLNLTPAPQGEWAISTRTENVSRPALPLNANGWNRFSVQKSASSVRFSVNGHPTFEDADSSSTSPWFHLSASAEQRPAFRNFKLTGKPNVPREVRLIEGDRLEGWACPGGRLPPRISVKEPPDRNQNYYGAMYDEDGQPIRQPNPTPDWAVADGVLAGRLDPAASQWAPSRLNYQRPILAGERVRYQFRYRPGLVEVHPALGKVVFLIEPQGVQLHWIDSDDGGPLVIEPDNRVDEASCRRGPERLPLKEDDWNDVELAIVNEQVQLRLNGSLIFERPIEPTSDRRFGLFHFKGQTAVEAREIVLSGDWPQSLPAGESGLLALATQAANDAVLRARDMRSSVRTSWATRPMRCGSGQ